MKSTFTFYSLPKEEFTNRKVKEKKVFTPLHQWQDDNNGLLPVHEVRVGVLDEVRFSGILL